MAENGITVAVLKAQTWNEEIISTPVLLTVKYPADDPIYSTAYKMFPTEYRRESGSIKGQDSLNQCCPARTRHQLSNLYSFFI